MTYSWASATAICCVYLNRCTEWSVSSVYGCICGSLKSKGLWCIGYLEWVDIVQFSNIRISIFVVKNLSSDGCNIVVGRLRSSIIVSFVGCILTIPLTMSMVVAVVAWRLAVDGSVSISVWFRRSSLKLLFGLVRAVFHVAMSLKFLQP